MTLALQSGFRKSGHIIMWASLKAHLGLSVLKSEIKRFENVSNSFIYFARRSNAFCVDIVSYFAPEYFMHGTVDEKTDVFSFGVLLLEIITGRQALDDSQQSLVIWVLSCVSSLPSYIP